MGRATPLYFAERLTTHYARLDGTGPQIYLKREDLNHTALKINLAQVLLAKRMSKQRIIAETGAGQHGVATATVCAIRSGLRYLHGRPRYGAEPECVPDAADGSRRASCSSWDRNLKMPLLAIRDWVTNETTHYILGSVAGPPPKWSATSMR